MTITNNQEKYCLAICELFNPYFHGFDYHSHSDITSQYLIFETVDIESFYNNDFKLSIQFLKSNYHRIINNNIETRRMLCLQHPIIKNYKNIISNSKYYTVDIVEIDVLTGEEHVAYKKTFWLSIFQRKWKNNYYKKIKFYKNPKNLFLRQINGR